MGSPREGEGPLCKSSVVDGVPMVLENKDGSSMDVLPWERAVGADAC